MNADAAVLRDPPIALDLAPDALARLSRLGEVRDYPVAGVVIAASQPCPGLGLILSGRVALSVRLPGRLPWTMLTLEAGDVVGWSAVLQAGPATATAIAIAPARLVLFEGEALRSALAGDPELAAAVYRRVLAAVARRLQATRLQLFDLYRNEVTAW